MTTSCFQSEITLRLNKDGSGTLTESNAFGPQALEMLSSFGGGAGGPDIATGMASEEKAKTRAAQLGEGVTVEKVEATSKDGWKGGTAVYRFTDINKLKFSPDAAAESAMPQMPGQPAPAVKKTEPITFKYAGDKLTVLIPEPKKNEEAPAKEATPEMGPEQEAMMKQMMTGMKVSVKIIAEPGIAETNASFADGNTITISEMEMSKILEQPGAFKKMSEAGQGDPAQALELMKSFQGVKVETKREITVTLK